MAKATKPAYGIGAPEDRAMIALDRRMVALFVDRSQPEHWVVRDPEGNFWLIPPIDNAWDSRQPFVPTEEAELEPVPGHYRYMLNLPF